MRRIECLISLNSSIDIFAFLIKLEIFWLKFMTHPDLSILYFFPNMVLPYPLPIDLGKSFLFFFNNLFFYPLYILTTVPLFPFLPFPLLQILSSIATSPSLQRRGTSLHWIPLFLSLSGLTEVLQGQGSWFFFLTSCTLDSSLNPRQCFYIPFLKLNRQVLDEQLVGLCHIVYNFSRKWQIVALTYLKQICIHLR